MVRLNCTIPEVSCSVPHQQGESSPLPYRSPAIKIINKLNCLPEPEMKSQTAAPASAPFYLSQTRRNFTVESWLLKKFLEIVTIQSFYLIRKM
jgi:hypothetical protein